MIPPRPIDIRLTLDQIEFCKRMAVARDGAADEGNLHETRSYGGDGRREPSWYGTFGEGAVCAAYGLELEKYIKANGKDGGVDVVINDKTYSVKATTSPNYNLIIPPHQDFDTDRALLVWPTQVVSTWSLVGWCTREMWDELKTKANNMPTPTWRVSWRDLKQIEREELR